MKNLYYFILFLSIIHFTLAFSSVIEKIFDSSSSEEQSTEKDQAPDNDLSTLAQAPSTWDTFWGVSNYKILKKLPLIDEGSENLLKYSQNSEKILAKRNSENDEEKVDETLKEMEKAVSHDEYSDISKNEKEVLENDPHRRFDKDSMKKRAKRNENLVFQLEDLKTSTDSWEKLDHIGYAEVNPDFEASEKEAQEKLFRKLKTQMKNREKIDDGKVEIWETKENIGFEDIKPDFNVTEEVPNQSNCCACASCWDESSVLGSESGTVGRWNRNLYSEKLQNFTDTFFACENDPLNIEQCDCNLENFEKKENSSTDIEKEKSKRCKRCCCIGMAVAATPMLTVGCGCGGCGIAMAVPATPMLIMGCGGGCGCGGGYGY